jgi:hypothetical protein
MYFLKNRFIETGSTGSLPVLVPVPVPVFKTMGKSNVNVINENSTNTPRVSPKISKMKNNSNEPLRR